MRIWFTAGFILALSFLAIGQSSLRGKTLDAQSGRPVPFVTLSVLNSRTGTTSDIMGMFELSVRANDTLMVSSIGYKPQRVPVGDITRLLTVKLEEMISELPEVSISPGENPAHRIIRKTIANRSQNNPENLRAYSYRAYHKFYATLDGPYESLPGKRAPEKNVDSVYFFLNESVTEKKYVAPASVKEVVLGNKMTGIEDPFFVVLATDFQPFTFYADHITLLGRNYRNPVSPGSISRYDFTLADTVFQKTDTVFIIRFEPLPGKTFDALQGQLHINSNGYALENVLAEPVDKFAKIQISIQQHYTFIYGHWFPKQLNTVFTLPDYKLGTRSLQYRHVTFVNQAEINADIPKQTFSFVNTEFATDANRKDSLFWNRERIVPLSNREKNTYHLYDTLNPRYKKILNSLMKGSSALATGKLPLGKFYLPVPHLLRFNEYEGVRAGLGIQTGERISTLFIGEVYAAYGFKDKGFKYGGSWQVNLKRTNEFFLKLSYQQDVSEPGNADFIASPFMASGGQSLRTWMTARMDSLRQSKIQVHFRPARFTQVALFVQHKKYNPAYRYEFLDPASEKPVHSFNVAEAGVQFRFAWREAYAQINSGKLVTSFAFPQINFSLSRGFTGLEGQYNFVKADLKIDQQFLTRGFGKTLLQLNAGGIRNPVPYPLLANGRGSQTGDSFLNKFVVPNQFQTMGLYEFVSDRYAYLFIRHNVGRLTGTQSKFFRPELELVHAMGIGSLNRPELHSITLRTLEKGYLESGLLVPNIIRFNYVDIAHYGIGAGVFYRYGPYQFQKQSDNVLFKIMLMFSI